MCSFSSVQFHTIDNKILEFVTIVNLSHGTSEVYLYKLARNNAIVAIKLVFSFKLLTCTISLHKKNRGFRLILKRKYQEPFRFIISSGHILSCFESLLLADGSYWQK